MALAAKNGTVHLGDSCMEYIRFGTGPKALILLPGLGDGLKTMKGTALPVGMMYRAFAGEYTVWSFSRKNDLPQGYTTRDMAEDQAKAMDILGIRKAAVVGVSMGGMIAQHFAADYPDRTEKLVLAVTCARENPILQEALAEWSDCVMRDDHGALMDSNLRRIYSDDYYRKNRWMIPLVGKLTKPKSYDRFLAMAEACRCHDAWDALARIQVPTLVLGGEKDRCLGGDASREIAERIAGAQLIMYPQWGHGLYEEAEDFLPVLRSFLEK